ncbi:hypothetical protein KVT40_000407 [Elsinoe batatas]|uniref:RNA polymerase II degradation factor 1 n=1 Tax=Elsinoe batatas TaxID=2601811 RepID=A0A8K0L8R2_9PEZI|nr:hypothetical protein KVT40_000407 [Elsinoe batatas]
MSEVDSRPAPSRGRSSFRGGRGGFGRGGPRGGHRQTNGTSNHQQEPSLDEQGELGDMKKQYASQLSMLKDMFPDWTDVDLVFALQETDGDLATTIDRITEGHVSQFSEIKKPKDRARSKAKDVPAESASTAPRGGRGRGGFEGTRGGRGRGDRARGVSRGGRGGVAKSADTHTDAATSTIPEANAWGAPVVDTTSAAEPAGDSSWGNVVIAEDTPKTASEGAKPSLLPGGPPKKTWASMFSQPKPAPAPAAPKVAPPPEAPVEVEQPAEPIPEPTVVEPEQPAISEEPSVELPIEPAAEPAAAAPEIVEPPAPLTEDNLENLPDVSHPPATQTVASNAGSEVRQTPAQQQPIGRPSASVGGYASTALRATSGITPRSASFQRRVAEQQEAVVLPGHNNVDRAAVQFGSMGLNGDSEDVDEEREEPETRTQPPQQSPQGQPRASLPPAPLQASAPAQDVFGGQSMPTPKQAPGLPPANPQQAQAAQAGTPDVSSSLPQQSQQGYNQYARYGQQDVSAPSQKSYDPFSHQTPSAFDQFSSQGQGAQQQSQQSQLGQQSQPGQQGQQSQQSQQSGYGGYSAAQSDYSQYYTSDQHRNAYQNYYNSAYGQQQPQSQHDMSGAQQRAGSSLGSGQGDSSYGGNQSAHQGRYNDPQGSGQNTPNPLGGQQQQSGPPQQSQQQQQHSGYGSFYGHPSYTSPYPYAYQQQYGYSGYGGAPYGGNRGGYGMNAPSSYDHSASPANTGFNQQSSSQSRDSGLGSGPGEYGRGSAQPSSLGSGGFGGVSDYSRGGSSYQGHGYGSQQGTSSDELKSFGGDSKSGPSPAVNQPGRPGSAANNGGQGQGQSGLPPPQSHQQQGFGGYPGFNQSSQYGGGLGGLGGQQHAGNQGGYNQYAGGFSNQYSQYGRGGWGASYGH